MEGRNNFFLFCHIILGQGVVLDYGASELASPPGSYSATAISVQREKLFS